MSAEKLDFDKGLPEGVAVSGYDAFQERGRYLLFIDMIGSVAEDLLLPHDHKYYKESLAWVSDPTNMGAWCGMIEASAKVAPTILKAVRDRPEEISQACETVRRSAHGDKNDLSAFMLAMGISGRRGSSSIVNVADEETGNSDDEVSSHALSS